MKKQEQPPALTIRNLSKTYDNGFQALTNVDLTIDQGGFFALLGANGAGKSTMISMISSLFPPTNGSIEIFGVDLLKNPNQAKSLLGVVPQEFNFMQFEKVIDILMVQAGYFGIAKHQAKPRAEELLQKLGLFNKANVTARSLSGGMKRRLMIARALMHSPKLLILDEPTAGVDIELRRSMWEFMEQINRDEGTTIILTTHYLEEAEQLCKKIAILDKGRIRINTDMKSLLASLDKETFIFDLHSPLTQAVTFDNVLNYRQIDPMTLEISVQKGSDLNGIFSQLTNQGIAVTSMRNKSNRLEELFINLLNETDSVGA